MLRDFRGRIALLAVVALACLATPSLAARRGVADATESAVAKANIAGHVISWEPLVSYDSISLIVSGSEGVVYETAFAPGSPVLFDLFDQNGVPLPDGTYSYELRVTPKISAQVRGLLETARFNGTDQETESRLRSMGALPNYPTALSGAFTIDNGGLVDPDVPEQSFGEEAGTDYRLGAVAPQDIIHNDDVLITMSLCVGTDCVNGESFGFDTIRLKENNLRIRAFDTSNSSSFPTRDWQITFNDSSNGGAEKFSIDDLDGGRTPFSIIAGAPSNSLFVDAQGDLGLGTSNPVVELHVVDGDSPTLRLEQNGSSGFAAQTWDVAGNEAGFFVRDVTGGSQLAFRILPGADSSSLVVAGDNNVGVGVLAPCPSGVCNGLHVRRSAGAGASLLRLENNNVVRFDLVNTSATSANGNWQFTVNASGNLTLNDVGDTSGGTELTLSADTGDANFEGDVTANGVVLTSDRNLKENIAPTDPVAVLQKVANLAVSNWNFKSRPGVSHLGPMAQDFYSLFGLGPDDRHINPMDLSSAALAAVQGLYKVVEDKDARISALEARLAALEKLLNKTN